MRLGALGTNRYFCIRGGYFSLSSIVAKRTMDRGETSPQKYVKLFKNVLDKDASIW